METILFLGIWIGGATLHTLIELIAKKWSISGLVVEPVREENSSNE